MTAIRYKCEQIQTNSKWSNYSVCLFSVCVSFALSVLLSFFILALLYGRFVDINFGSWSVFPKLRLNVNHLRCKEWYHYTYTHFRICLYFGNDVIVWRAWLKEKKCFFFFFVLFRKTKQLPDIIRHRIQPWPKHFSSLTFIWLNRFLNEAYIHSGIYVYLYICNAFSTSHSGSPQRTPAKAKSKANILIKRELFSKMCQR